MASLRPLLALCLLLAACASSAQDEPASAAPQSHAFAQIAPATGLVAAPNPRSDAPLSGFVFTNDGSSSVTITKLEVDLVGGQTVHGAAGFGVAPGQAITFLFDSQHTHLVDRLAFAVEGSTEKLVVEGTDQTGVVPSTSAR